jgi:hypothetical protein
MFGNFGKMITIVLVVIIIGTASQFVSAAGKMSAVRVVNGSSSPSTNQTNNENATGDDGLVVGNHSDTKPESDDGIPDTLDLVLVILFVILLAAISIGTILFFRRRSIKEVQWEDDEEWTDDDYDDEEPIPEEGRVDSGNL